MSISTAELERITTRLVERHGKERLAIASMLSFFASIGFIDRKGEASVHFNTLLTLVQPELHRRGISMRQLQTAANEMSQANDTITLIEKLFD